MSSVTNDEFGPFCGTLGCTEDADVVIDHPKHGERIACNGCATGYVVIRRV